jgi:hypothetical protein
MSNRVQQGRRWFSLVLSAFLFAACGSSGERGGTAGAGGSAAGVGGSSAGGAGGSMTLGGCVDRIGGTNTTATPVNHPDGICDTYGSFTLTVSGAGSDTATNVVLFRSDATGTNLASGGGHVNYGAWTTEIGAQNIPGNYAGHLFIATTASPAPNDFVALTGTLSLTLAAGENVFHFFANSDDSRGGSYGFGLNVWLGAAAAASPTLSAFGATPGNAFVVDGTTGCSPAYDGSCGVSADTLATTSSPTVTLTSFTVAGVGGGQAPVDAGTSD